MRLSPAAASLVFALVPAATAGGGSGETVPFRLRGEADIVVPVLVDGRGPFRFLLDTGSSRSAISPETAARLRRRAIASTPVVTPAGRTSGALARLERVTLGPGDPVSLVVLILPEDETRGASIDGVIGQDLLARRAYTIDYGRQELIWRSAEGSVPAGTRLPLEWSQGRFIVSLSQEPGGRVRLIPDSGASGFVLFDSRDRPLLPLTPLGTTLLKTLAGQRVVRRVLMERLDLGPIRLHDQPAVVVDRPAGMAAEDGLLPLHLFPRVTIDGPGRQLFVEAR